MWSPTKRSDGVLADGVPPYRRFMPAIMTSGNSSVVYFDQSVRLDRTLDYLATVAADNPGLDPSLFHVVLWALARTLEARPGLNRFLAGGRLYQRGGIWISYSIKKKLADHSPIEVVKREFDPRLSFVELVRTVDEDVSGVRDTAATLADREVEWLLKFPGPARRMLVRLVNGLDDMNLLPASYIKGDAFFASVFVANLGSLHLDSAFHHLYEYGNVPIFCTIGQIHDTPVVEDGEVVSRPVASLKFSFDERIEDGLYAQRSLQTLKAIIEDPEGVEG